MITPEQLSTSEIQSTTEYSNNQYSFTPSNEDESQITYDICKQVKRLQFEVLTPDVKRNKCGKKPFLHLFSSFSTTPSTSSIGRSGSQDEFNCPQKQFQSSKIQIDQSDDLEQKIHDWLDKQNVKIADPYDKVADFYHKARVSAFNVHFDNLQDSELNTLESLPTTTSLKKTASVLVLGTSPIIQRRNKIQSSENRSEFGNRHYLLQDNEDIQVSEFQHA